MKKEKVATGILQKMKKSIHARAESTQRQAK
jgi:hypothetical protein